MSEETVTQPEANPYNARKSWNKKRDQVQRGMMSADDALFRPEPPAQEDPVDELENPEVEATSVEEEEVAEETPSKYSKVDYKKRYDDLKRHYDKKVSEFKDKEQRLREEAESSRPKYTPPKTPEELATFREEYPDIYAVVETVAHSQATGQVKDLLQKIERLEQREQELLADSAHKQLLAYHPDFPELSQSDEFHSWAEQQPEEIQNWVYNNSTNASLAARAIDLFKRDTGRLSDKQEKEVKPKPQPKKEATPSAADAVKVSERAEAPQGGKKVWTTSEIDALSVEQYDELSAELDKAFQEGRIVRG